MINIDDIVVYDRDHIFLFLKVKQVLNKESYKNIVKGVLFDKFSKVNNIYICERLDGGTFSKGLSWFLDNPHECAFADIYLRKAVMRPLYI